MIRPRSPGTRNRPRGATILPLDIAITVPATATDPARTWNAAWNAADTLTAPDGTPIAPHNQLWATHAGVIIGPDLTWTNGHWTAHPDQSHDPKLRTLTPGQYLPYALNTYRVLLTPRRPHHPYPLRRPRHPLHAAEPDPPHPLQSRDPGLEVLERVERPLERGERQPGSEGLPRWPNAEAQASASARA